MQWICSLYLSALQPQQHHYYNNMFKNPPLPRSSLKNQTTNRVFRNRLFFSSIQSPSLFRLRDKRNVQPHTYVPHLLRKCPLQHVIPVHIQGKKRYTKALRHIHPRPFPNPKSFTSRVVPRAQIESGKELKSSPAVYQQLLMPSYDINTVLSPGSKKYN